MPLPKRSISLSAAVLAVGVIAVGVAVSGAPQRASAAVVGPDIYVDNLSGANCSDTGSASGSEATPFCTISAAAAVAQPGQTVIVEGGVYAPVTISVSGEPGNPITFQGATTQTAVIEATAKTTAVLVSGAHNVVISGFRVEASGAPGYEVTGSSSDVTIDGTDLLPNPTAPGIEVDAASDVTVSRSSLVGGTGVQVNSGASGVVVTGNTLVSTGPYSAVAVTGAPGTDVTGNTLSVQCGPAIDVSGASAGASIENNIVTSSDHAPSSACTDADGTTAIAVSADSTSGTTADYNLISQSSAFTAMYDWGGTTYRDLATFQGATGQGAHDLAGNPLLGAQQDTTTVNRGTAVWYPVDNGSQAIDSANADAPGELATDQLGDPRSDDPNVANTGAGSGSGTSTTYFDRGAVELEGDSQWGGQSVSVSGPLTVTAQQQITPTWPTNGPLYFYSYSFDGGATSYTGASSIQHTFEVAGTHTISMGVYQGGLNLIEGVRTYDAVVGADYTPVAPVRILDTRYGTGVARAGAIPGRGKLTLSIPAIDGVPAADISAVVMNVTVTEPTAPGDLTVYPGDGTPPGTSNLNFTVGQTVPNLVTVQLSGGKVSFHNASAGPVQVVADLSGFYGPGGYGFQPQSPARVVDTRVGTGAPRQPLASGSRIQLNLAGKVPAGTAAVALNVTVTGPQRAGFLKVYPDSPVVPGTSSVNFTAGQTVANLVIVPVANDIADIYNSSPGTVQVIADLTGYFATGAPDSFVPYGPIRTDDTRGTSLGPVKPGATYTVGSAYPYLDDDHGSCPALACPPAVALVTNITVTQPTRGGDLSVYPYNSARPATSTLNFSAGQTVPNLVVMKQAPGDWALDAYNDSPGTLQLVADEYGYFITAAG
jgi:Right handed beta helix region